MRGVFDFDASKSGEDNVFYNVVVNHEEQYSIWPATRPNPAGWRDAGKTGLKAECLEYITSVWTDMRPLSLRSKMDAWTRQRHDLPEPPDDNDREEGTSLVERLCRGNHPVEVILRPKRTLAAFRERLDVGVVHVAFTTTVGGTELGIRLDPHRVDVSFANFHKSEGRVRLVGGLTLDYVNVICVADINIATLDGTAHLERIANA